MKVMEWTGKWVLCLGAAGAISLGGCHRVSSPAIKAGAAPVPVRTIVPQSSGLSREVGVAGIVRGIHEAKLSARVSGQVREIDVRLGQRVSPGQILLALSSKTLGAEQARAAANRDYAQSNFDRIDRLYRDKSASRAEWDAARQSRDNSAAAYAAATARLGWSSVRAPFSGRVTSKSVRVGDVVLPGAPLLAIVDDSRLEVLAHVPDALSPDLSRSSPVRFVSHGREFVGRIVEVSPGSDPVTHTVSVRVLLGGGGAHRGSGKVPVLRSGGFGKLYIPVSGRSSVRLPVSAILDREGLREVFVVSGGHAELRYVRTGRLVGGTVEILSGLAPGEKVADSPSPALVDGAPVAEVAP
ncbi:MAG: efflux RND transporter periplasmic adaptor subunit [Leptospirillia bacterium]